MNVALNPVTLNHALRIPMLAASVVAKPDPVLAAIDQFWSAFYAFQKAKRRQELLHKRLDENVTRQPRVQYGWLLKGRDNAGNDIKEPIYRRSDFDIDYAINENLRHYKAMVGKNRDARRNLMSRFAAKRAELKKALKADAAELEIRQRVSDYWQALQAERITSSAFYDARYKVFHMRPTTTDGALAALRFIQRVQQFDSRSKEKNFGPGAIYMSVLVAYCCDVLEAAKGSPEITRRGLN
jgi:hypothetical protein